MRGPRFAILALALVLASSAPPLSAQCAMCQTALTQSPEGRTLSESFNRAILLMLAAPYLVFGSLSAFAFRGRLREAARRALGRTGSR